MFKPLGVWGSDIFLIFSYLLLYAWNPTDLSALKDF